MTSRTWSFGQRMSMSGMDLRRPVDRERPGQVKVQLTPDVLGIRWRNRLTQFVPRHPRNAHRATSRSNIRKVTNNLHDLTCLWWPPHLDLWTIVTRTDRRAECQRSFKQTMPVQIQIERTA